MTGLVGLWGGSELSVLCFLVDRLLLICSGLGFLGLIRGWFCLCVCVGLVWLYSTCFIVYCLCF